MDKFEMFYVPVADLEAALAHYRDVMGWSEQWREGDSTAAIGPASGDVALMLDVDTSARPGPILTVNDARAWIDQRRNTLTVVAEAAQIPGGWWGAVADPSGNLTYIIDQSSADDS